MVRYLIVAVAAAAAVLRVINLVVRLEYNMLQFISAKQQGGCHQPLVIGGTPSSTCAMPANPTNSVPSQTASKISPFPGKNCDSRPLRVIAYMSLRLELGVICLLCDLPVSNP